MADNGIKRDAKGRFVKGSRSPSPGRPATSKAFRERCRQYMTEEGWDLLAAMARTPGKDQRPALELIAAYAYGRPTQPIAGDDELPAVHVVGRIAGLSEEELARLAGVDLAEGPRE